jgi:hypothetical protein
MPINVNFLDLKKEQQKQVLADVIAARSLNQ